MGDIIEATRLALEKQNSLRLNNEEQKESYIGN